MESTLCPRVRRYNSLSCLNQKVNITYSMVLHKSRNFREDKNTSFRAQPDHRKHFFCVFFVCAIFFPFTSVYWSRNPISYLTPSRAITTHHCHCTPIYSDAHNLCSSLLLTQSYCWNQALQFIHFPSLLVQEIWSPVTRSGLLNPFISPHFLPPPFLKANSVSFLHFERKSKQICLGFYHH